MLRYGASIAHFTECKYGSLDEIVGVGTTLGLGKDILDAEALKYRTHSTTCYHTSTF